MVFSSIIFILFFLPVFLAAYYVVKLLGNTPQRNTRRLLVGLSVDVYRGKHEALKRPLDYLLYIMMFPHLLAGPIIRFEFIAHQIRQREDS